MPVWPIDCPPFPCGVWNLSLQCLKSHRNALLAPAISWPNDFTTLGSAELHIATQRHAGAERGQSKGKNKRDKLIIYQATWWYSIFKILSYLTCDSDDHIEGLVHLKIKILSFTLHVVPNLHDSLYGSLFLPQKKKEVIAAFSSIQHLFLAIQSL